MKNNTVKGILTATLIVAGSVSSFAQSPDLARRKIVNDSVTQVFAREFVQRKQKVESFALANGLEIKKEKDGKITELVDVLDNGTPIYISTSNAGSAITSRSNLLYPGGSAGLNLTGKGIYAGIWDGGAVLSNHVTFRTGRVTLGESADAILHATHVAGTMVGSAAGTPAAKGIAYEGTLVSYYWDNDLTEMNAEASKGVMVVSNHSYGLNSENHDASYIPLYGKYGSQSAGADRIMYNNPTYQVVVAAGNDREDTKINPSKSGNDLLSQFATAKNTLVVAAVYEVLSYTDPGSVKVAPFSSYGPTDDFRIKPDIATKGVDVYSSVITTPAPSSISKYDYLQGTSMASPGISGVVMLLQQHYSNLHEGKYMWSSSVRALIAHTADEIGSNPGPDHMTGWGLINAAKAAGVISKQGTADVIFEQNNLAQGATYSFDVVSKGGPLTATLAWTDPAGTADNSSNVDTATAALVNDLDIKVVNKADNSTIYYPWRLRNAFASPIALNNGTNSVDNIEKVEASVPAGTYTVTISHKKAALSGGSQNYSLVVTTAEGEVAAVTDVKNDFFSVWPNPANDVLNITLKSGLSGDTNVSMFDVQGRQVLTKKLTGSNDVLDINHLSGGFYIVKLTQGNKQYVKKVLVK